MAVENRVDVWINGINRSPHVVYPVKFGNFLDERLDECSLSLRLIDEESFTPLTPVEIDVNNVLTFVFGGKPQSTQVETYYFIVGNDDAEEAILGSGLYNHELYLLEVTKVAECVVCDTITFTNDLGRIYADPTPVRPTVAFNNMLTSNDVVEQTSNGYSIPSGHKPGSYYVPSFGQLNTFRWVSHDNDIGVGTSTSYSVIPRIFVYAADDYIPRTNYESEDITKPSGTAIATGIPSSERGGPLNGLTTTLQEGKYIVEYIFYMQRVVMNRAPDGTPLQGYPKFFYQGSYCCTYRFVIIDNVLPLKKLTITDVINRTLDIAEPLRAGQKPRFRLNGMRADGTIITEANKQAGETVGQAAEFEQILAPEFAFTKQTLRECLQQVGGVIHGEPRLTPKKDAEGWYYEVRYDMFTGDDESNIRFVPYTGEANRLTIENYLGHVDTTAENLVNQLDKFAGVIVEPYEGGARSVRTDSAFVRIEEGNMIIPTLYPIYTVSKLEYVYVSGGELKTVDIVPYLFEKSIYDSNLSSYDEAYPYSKSYALYFSQGQKNIQGLNFKVPAATDISAALKQYAIVNILREVLQDESYTPDYPKMCFRVTYTPFYTARVAQTKVNYKDSPFPAALIYNQSANVIESRAYGENLKGVVARLGNLEKSVTYLLWTLDQIPRAGQKFDDNFFISAVATEVYPSMLKSTIGLSKDFNRLSEYIGISSVKRYYEVSSAQAVERNTLYREYIVIGKAEEADSDTRIGGELLKAIASMFSLQLRTSDRVTNVIAWGQTYGQDDLNAVNLPVVSSAFGNSLSFSWQYADNYSAGDMSVYQSNNNVKGNFQQSLPYGDFYGRLYYYNFLLQFAGEELTSNNYQQIADSLPKAEIPSPISKSASIADTFDSPYILRKDSREALQINFQVDFVSNLEGLIIGSALAAYCPLVRGPVSSFPYLYVFPTKLNKFTDHVESFTKVKLADLPKQFVVATVVAGGVIISALGLNPTFSTDGKAWAIVTPQSTKVTKVQGDDGQITEQVEYIGGDLLIGQNMDIKAGDRTPIIHMTKKSEIFDKTVWKDRW